MHSITIRASKTAHRSAKNWKLEERVQRATLSTLLEIEQPLGSVPQHSQTLPLQLIMNTPSSKMSSI